MPYIEAYKIDFNERIVGNVTPASAYRLFRNHYQDVDLPESFSYEEGGYIHFAKKRGDNSGKRIQLTIAFMPENNGLNISGALKYPSSKTCWTIGILTLPFAGFGLIWIGVLVVFDWLSPKSTEGIESLKSAIKRTEEDLLKLRKEASPNDNVSLANKNAGTNLETLKTLAQLKESGALTEDEFEEQKKKLLENLTSW